MEKYINKLITRIKNSNIYICFTLNRNVLVCLLLTLGIFSILKITNVLDWATFLGAFIPTFLSLCATFINFKEYSSNIKIISLCYDYMHNKEGISIDDILGILISNKYRSKFHQPTNTFFDILEEKCNLGEVEERRRIAEAIPMLFKINKYRTKKIVEKLRGDYDDYYRDDNRRRTIESFRYCSRMDSHFVKKMLKRREGDSIYTTVAIIETIIFTNIILKKDKERELFNLKNCIKDGFSKTQQEFVDEAIDFLSIINRIKRTEDLDIIFEGYMDKFKNSKFYMKILISKNMINICPYHEQCKRKDICLNVDNKKAVLEFFDLCFQDEKNVRRPMAKEDVCYCLLRMMAFPEVKGEAKKRIMNLFKDKDKIISVTAFDYIYDIYDRDINLFKEILKYCTELPDGDILRIRAEHIKNMLVASDL